jgi:hypothetical protein
VSHVVSVVDYMRSIPGVTKDIVSQLPALLVKGLFALFYKLSRVLCHVNAFLTTRLPFPKISSVWDRQTFKLVCLTYFHKG